MNPYFTEVIDAHIAIERWLGKGAGEEQALLARFTPDFSMIALNGAPLDFAALCAFFRAHRAAKPGLEIEIEEMKLVAEWPTGAVVSYREKQSRGKAPRCAIPRWSLNVSPTYSSGGICTKPPQRNNYRKLPAKNSSQPTITPHRVTALKMTSNR